MDSQVLFSMVYLFDLSRKKLEMICIEARCHLVTVSMQNHRNSNKQDISGLYFTSYCLIIARR